MQEELNSLYKNSAWTLTELPEGQKVTDSKWVFRSKRMPKGTLCVLKQVAKGFFQKKGKDYEDTFSPVVSSTLKTLIALAVELDLTIEHMDVKTAILNGNLLETIYMTQPEGFVRENENHLICKFVTMHLSGRRCIVTTHRKPRQNSSR